MGNSSRFAFLGNCQAGALCSAAKSLVSSAEVPFKHFLFFSTEVSEGSGIQDAKNYLLQYMPEDTYRRVVSQGHLLINPSLKDLQDYSIDCCAMNQFHERPYFKHRDLGFIVSYTPFLFLHHCDSTHLKEDFQKNFEVVSPDPFTYFTRYKQFVEDVVSCGVANKYYIFKRLSPSAFKFKTRSWLSNYSALESQCAECLSSISDLYGRDVDIIDADDYLEEFRASFPEIDYCFDFNVFLNNGADFLGSITFDIEHMPDLIYGQVAFDLLKKSNVKDLMDQNVDNYSKKHGDIKSLIGAFREANIAASLKALKSCLEVEFNLNFIIVAAIKFREPYERKQIEELLDSIHESYQGRVASIYKEMMLAYDAVCTTRASMKANYAGLKVAIWGAGGRLEYILNNSDLLEDVDIQFIIDSSAAKQGALFSGFKVVSPESVKEEIHVVLVTSTHFDEIASYGKSIPALSNALFLATENLVLAAYVNSCDSVAELNL